MKSHRIIFYIGAILGARCLLAHGKPVEVSQRDVKRDVSKEVTHCNDIHGCRRLYEESSNRGDLASLIWTRGSGEGAAGEGAAGEGAAGEGAAGEGVQGGAHGEGAQGGGAQGGGAQGGAQGGAEGEGAQGESPSNPQSEGSEGPDIPPLDSPSEPSDYLAGSDGSLPDRSSSEIGIDDSAQEKSPESQEVLTMEEYTTKGQGYFDNMMQAIDGKTERPTYASFNDR